MSQELTLRDKIVAIPQYFIQFIYTQINMKKILTIIGTVLAGGAILTAIFFGFFNPRDFSAEASEALEQAKSYHEKARDLTCSYIGSLTSKCYQKNLTACSQLQVAEANYSSEFGSSAYNACFNAAPPTPTAVPAVDGATTSVSSSVAVVPATDVNNPLFLGDEGQKLPK